MDVTTVKISKVVFKSVIKVMFYNANKVGIFAGLNYYQ